MHLPDPVDGGRMELVRGSVVVEMAPGGGHGELTTLLILALGEFVRRHHIGKLVNDAGFWLERDPDTVRAPDVAFLGAAEIPEGGIPKEGYIPYRPTLAVEVVSPNDLDANVMGKVDDYLTAGVPRVWVVRPKRQTVTVYHQGGTARIYGMDGVLSSDDAGFAVEGFALSLHELFS